MSWENPIPLTPADEFLVIGAVRYARGRATYIVEMTCEWVIAHWEQLSDNTRSVIARDVRLEVELRRNEGAEQSALSRIDNPAWERLLDIVEKESTE
ncbi:hypothetical protein [Corynebacterium lujinxingii]|uniref:Uncharacterized protein n=1 Tax=Corynebacterium lujinxingii TaxID=2763010 RepID=A0A7H0K0Q0_9CORY|nr:hypothetical protein [Corynebacterium lujinxingii]MBC3179390.1 hypothetical protein [Corynebacterium lujinxingii]NNO11497.1 hypothetical protein [Corynebacterium lujinxingii]QNP90866.1 hypothetical protein IAU68_03625 [Corynebacterium lujinxingii]